MARGRFLWGVGSGGFPGDLELFELDAKAGEHRAVTRAMLDLVLDLWNDPKPGRLRGAALAVPRPGAAGGHRAPAPPPAVPAAPPADRGRRGRPRSRTRSTLAGERGYIPMSINFVPPRVLKTHWASVEAGARQGGRVADRTTWRIARDVFIADTTAEARRQALAGAAGPGLDRLLLPAAHEGTRARASSSRIPRCPTARVTLEYLADNIWLVGDPDEVVRRIRAAPRRGRRLRHAPRHRPRVGAARGVDALDAAARRGRAPAAVTPNHQETIP